MAHSPEAGVWDAPSDLGDDFEDDAAAVFEGAAVVVGAEVGGWAEELGKEV